MPRGFLMKDWRDFLNEAPVSSYQKKISILEPMKNVDVVGYYAMSETKGRSNYGGKNDPIFLDYLNRTGENVPFDREKYCVTADTHQNVNASVRKYDRESKFPVIDDVLYKQALEDTKRFYGPLRGKCRILSFDELEYVPSTNPGVKYKLAGCRSKEQALDSYRDQIEKAWELHHVLKVPCLWKQAAKIELLKMAKVKEGDLRGFTCPEIDYLFCCMRMNGDFNVRTHAYADKFDTMISRVGFTLQNGGFTRLCNRHDRKDCHVGEGDAWKWDSCLDEELFQVCKEVRFDCWDKEGMSADEWWARQDWYYENKVHSYILLPSGQIVLKHTGNPSGQDSTTDDNCIMHTFIICYAWRKLFGRSLYDDRFEARFDIYADDHVWSVPEKFKKWADFDTRRKIYDEFGVKLSKEKDLVTHSIEGHTFLGPTARLIDGTWCPVFNRDKALCAAFKMDHDFPVDIQVGRILSIMINVCFDRPAFDLLRDYAFYLLELCKTITFPDDLDLGFLSINWLKRVPSHTEVVDFWLGRE